MLNLSLSKIDIRTFLLNNIKEIIIIIFLAINSRIKDMILLNKIRNNRTDTVIFNKIKENKIKDMDSRIKDMDNSIKDLDNKIRATDNKVRDMDNKIKIIQYNKIKDRTVGNNKDIITKEINNRIKDLAINFRNRIKDITKITTKDLTIRISRIILTALRNLDLTMKIYKTTTIF